MDVGLAYNKAMALLGVDDWAVMMDHDVALCSRKWFRVIAAAIANDPGAGAFVACTNRLNPKKSMWQLVNVNRDDDRILHHCKIADDRMREHGSAVIDVTDVEQDKRGMPFSGFFFAVSKATWTAIGGAPHGFGRVDYEIHRRIRASGRRIYLLPGLYVFHRFKMEGELAQL
jgi:GT2 family glycosyltransferase